MRARDCELSVGERLYRAAARGAFPLLWQAARWWGLGEEERRWRAGEMPEAPGPLLWFHGASAGELAAAGALAALLRRNGSRFTAAFTATNRAGLEFAAHIAGDEGIRALVPWDHPAWVGRALDRWRPAALFLVETELWPNLVIEASRRDVPVFCVSARIYPGDVVRYRLIRGVIGPVLRRVTLVLAQNETERARFLGLGAVASRCVVGGNLKHAGGATAPAGDAQLREALGLRNEDEVVVFGSVHADEVGVVFAALESVRSDTLRVLIAPRHEAAIAVIGREAHRRGWRIARRSADPPPAAWQVLVLDRMGELSSAYAIGSIAVVGGGFGRHGGHNPVEPVLAGTPVLFGRHGEHFGPETGALAAATPAARVEGAAQLGERLAEWMADGARRRDVLERQRQALPDGTAVADAYVSALAPWLGGLAGPG